MIALYRLFAFIGLMAVPAAFIYGFRHDATAPIENYLYNFILFAAFFAIHWIMMLPAVKRLITGRPEGSAGERRLYIFVSVVTWLAVLALHRPVPGPAYVPPEWLAFLGLCLVLLGVFAFFENMTFAAAEGFFGVPGAAMSHTVLAPLLTEGSYARVRHPMYRGALAMGLASLLIHPNVAQLFWAGMIGLTFLIFIPIEEAQLLRVRGDAYRRYMEITRYRIIRGVW